MSLLYFWALNISVGLQSMEGQKALGFHQIYLNLCSKDERRSYTFFVWNDMRVINDRIFIFVWTITLHFPIGSSFHVIRFFFSCNNSTMNGYQSFQASKRMQNPHRKEQLGYSSKCVPKKNKVIWNLNDMKVSR